MEITRNKEQRVWNTGGRATDRGAKLSGGCEN